MIRRFADFFMLGAEKGKIICNKGNGVSFDKTKHITYCSGGRKMSEEITMLTEWVDLFHGFGSWQPIIAAAAILLFFILARGIFARLLFSIFLGLTHKTKTEMDNNILLAFRKPLKALILLIGV